MIQRSRRQHKENIIVTDCNTEPGSNLEITNRGNKYRGLWKSQVSQTVEVPAVTDHGSPGCHRPWKYQLSQTKGHTSRTS
ncbi:hypothetical protein LSAT2_031496 [Lamellibrachia satsuma]|nr:hypothetical protein LSAT2_031496 [Lamellibrachia satsuma]